jgi:nicotinamide-nucleotide amidase
MIAEIITIGDEILIGQIVDSNSAYIGQELNKTGISVTQITTVSDDRDKILNAISAAESRAELIILTGGLGPTKDDITKKTIAEYFGDELVFNQGVYDHVNKLLSGRGVSMNDLNSKQAYVPSSCKVLANDVGTAPGMLFEKNNKTYFSIPGVPFEMKFLISERLIPYLKQKYKFNDIIHKVIMTQGIPESHLAKRIEDWENNLPSEIKLAYLPQPGFVRLRLSAQGDKNILLKLIEKEIRKLNKIIPEAIFGYDEEKIEFSVFNLLKSKNKTLSTAESCTGGNISALITSISGSSEVFKGTVVSYSNEIKENVLGVKLETLKKHGAVSQKVVEEMVKGVLKIMKTDYAIAVSGIAGPTGGTNDKPVGTTWIAVGTKDKIISEKHLFGEERSRNIRRASITALNILRNFIK